jgi:hypothetical protein
MKNNDEKKIKLVLLVGEGHSGSTLLDLIMNSHSKIFGVGEISHYTRMKKSDSFWRKVVKGVNYKYLPLMGRKKIDFIFNKNNFVYFDNNKHNILNVHKYIKETEKLYRNSLLISGKKIIFDSSKSFERFEIFANSNKFDIVLLHLVRDGRGVTYSNIKLGRSPFKYMKKWFITNIKIEIIKKRNKKNKNIFILYEDFVNNPEKIIKFILKEIGLYFESDMMSFKDKERHQVGGNYNLRFKSKGNSIKLDDKWREEMNFFNKFIFNILFGWLNLFYKLKSKKYDK